MKNLYNKHADAKRLGACSHSIEKSGLCFKFARGVHTKDEEEKLLTCKFSWRATKSRNIFCLRWINMWAEPKPRQRR